MIYDEWSKLVRWYMMSGVKWVSDDILMSGVKLVRWYMMSGGNWWDDIWWVQ